MKRTVFFILSGLIVSLSGCWKEIIDIENYYNEPAIVRFTSDTPKRSMIETMHGTYLTSTLFNGLNDGDLLWTNFQIDGNNQPYSDMLTVTSLQYVQIYSTVARLKQEDDIIDEYDPIDFMFMDIKPIKNMLFFWFRHDDVPDGQTYSYEMLFDDPLDASEIPTLYIGAKKTNAPVTSVYDNLVTAYGFDMTSYIEKYFERVPNASEIKFHLKFFANVEDEDADDDGFVMFNLGHVSWPYDNNN